eukprot:gene7482-10197_t
MLSPQTSFRSITSRTSFSSTGSSSFTYNPPFALDDDDAYTVKSHSYDSTGSYDSQGYRKGGPKEARLRRVALLSKQKETDHLFPVKVKNIPLNITPEKLKESLEKLGPIEDIYIPKNLKNGLAAKDFAVIRFPEEEIALKVLSSSESINIEGNAIKLAPLSPQKSFFTHGTGSLGITNQAFDDGTRNVSKVPPKQDITLESCMARSGYPWESKRELKFLAPHTASNSVEMYSVKITELPKHIKVEQIREVFEKYGEIGDISCPKPLQVNERISHPNNGFAFVRYFDKRNADAALTDIYRGAVVFDGSSVKGELLMPLNWPTESTRRYY